jgi:hypothetical protein
MAAQKSLEKALVEDNSEVSPLKILSGAENIVFA